MKYKSKTYAKALADCLSAKDANENLPSHEVSARQRKIAVNFLALLKKNQDLKKANEIVLMAKKLLLKRTGNKKVILETARKTDTKNFVNSFAKKGDVVEEKINPALVAGIKIQVDGSKQLDLSLLHKLNSIFK